MDETTAAKDNAPEILPRIAGSFLLLLLLFFASAISGYFLGDRLFGDFLYTPIIPDWYADTADVIHSVCTGLHGTAVQCLLLFAGGLLFYPMAIPVAVSLYRGFCLGCVICLYIRSLIPDHHIPFYLSVYFAASVCMFFFSASGSAHWLQRRYCTAEPHTHSFCMYMFSFLAVSGTVFMLYYIPFFLV